MVKFMKVALELAAKHKGQTSPNPMVGAVVVQNGRIVGQGAHQRAGTPHAEVIALEQAGKLAIGSVLYVNLEPCCHNGKTPPCTTKIISSGVKKVIAAMKDPNPLVRGKGFKQLQQARIEVEIGLLEKEAKKLNEIFIKFISTGKPFIIMKAAISIDGKIATVTGDSKWISNERSRRKVYELRNQVDAIIVGENTLLTDNPRLNVHNIPNPHNPLKIVITKKLDIDPVKIKEMNININDNNLLFVAVNNSENISQTKIYTKNGIETLLVNSANNHLNLDELLSKLGKKKITSVLLEGGSYIYTSFLKAGLVDKIHLFQSPIIIGNDGIPMVRNMANNVITDSMKLKNIEVERLYEDIHISGYLEKN